MVNKNTVSRVDKLLILSQFKISLLQCIIFFLALFSPLLSRNTFCWFIYWCICFHSRFGCSGGWWGGEGSCPPPHLSHQLHLSHLAEFSALIFLPLIRSLLLLRQLSGSDQKLGAVGVISSGGVLSDVYGAQFPGIFSSVVGTMRECCRILRTAMFCTAIYYKGARVMIFFFFFWLLSLCSSSTGSGNPSCKQAAPPFWGVYGWRFAVLSQQDAWSSSLCNCSIASSEEKNSLHA